MWSLTSSEKTLSGDFEFIQVRLLLIDESLSVRTIFTSGAVTETFSVAPTRAERADGRQRVRLNGVVQRICFVTEVAFKPTVADFVDWNDVNGFCDTAFSGNAKTRITADSLNEHAIDFETCAIEQEAVVIELNCPVENVANTVKAQLGTEFVLSLLAA